MKTVKSLELKDIQIINKAILEKHPDGGVAIAIVDSHGELLSFLRTDGCPLAAGQIARNKAFTAVRDRQPSGSLGENSRKYGFAVTDLGDPRFTGLGGGLPIETDGAYIGAVGVSGLSQEEDAALSAYGINSLLKAGASQPSED
ncbi:MAG: heme-binding protein [Spirochaetales bacterium]|nr:heme-binding protein [Spirochaetales bacterium]